MVEAMTRHFAVFAYTRRAVELVWVTNARLAITLALLTLAAGLLPAAMAWVGKLIVDGVVLQMDTVRGGAAADMETLAYELVQEGLNAAGSDAVDMHTRVVNRVERELIDQVMQACDGVQVKAAACLGINRNTLHKKLKEYGLEK